MHQKDDMTLKELVLKLQEWWKFILGKWLIIVVCGLVGAGLGLTYALLKKPNYESELTFVLEENKSSQLGSYAGLASQFGIDLGLNSSVGVFSGDNILEFLKSRFIVEKTLLSPLKIKGQVKSLAEFYLEINRLNKGWEKDSVLRHVEFPSNADRKGFSRQQDSILNMLYQRIVKSDLVVTKPDRKLSFISVKCVSRDEVFSKEFVEHLVKEATDFYIDTKTKRSKTNVDILQSKADSLEELLNRKTYSAAAAQDLNQNPARRMATVSTEVVSRDKQVLQTIYGEAIKNLELSRMAMAQETPVIQIVDVPILPLKVVKTGKLKGLVIGGFLGGFLTLAILLTRRIYREIMR